MGWTTTELLARVRAYARLSDSEPDFTDEILLLGADDVLRTRLSEVVASLRQHYWVHTTDVALAPGQTSIPLPSRALGESILDVTALDGSGNRQTLTGPLPLGSDDVLTEESGFVVGDGTLRLTTSHLTGTVRIRYELQRSKLVPASRAARIDRFEVIGPDTYLRAVYAPGVPATWTLGDPNHVTAPVQPTLLDLVEARPPFRAHAIDVYPAGLNTGTPGYVSLPTSSIPSGLRVGDYLAVAGETPIVPCPDVLWPALTNLVAGDVLSQLGDTAGAQQRLAIGEKAIESARSLLSPRVKAMPETLTPNGLFRRGGYGGL